MQDIIASDTDNNSCAVLLCYTPISYSNGGALLKYGLLIRKYIWHLILNIWLLLLNSGMRNLDNCDSCLIYHKKAVVLLKGQGVL